MKHLRAHMRRFLLLAAQCGALAGSQRAHLTHACAAQTADGDTIDPRALAHQRSLAGGDAGCERIATATPAGRAPVALSSSPRRRAAPHNLALPEYDEQSSQRFGSGTAPAHAQAHAGAGAWAGMSKLSEGTTTSSFDSDHSTPVIAEEDGETTAAAAAAASSRPVAVRGVAAADAKFKEPPPALALPPWDAYFERRYYVPLSSAVSGPKHSLRTASVTAEAVYAGDDQDVAQVYEVGSHGPLVVCVHGGGYSALSWALVARHLKSKEVRVAAFDLRGYVHQLKSAKRWRGFRLWYQSSAIHLADEDV
eukprot:scaffold705_cov402-Prasinococcus_capsulatus_cf.AAC.9